MKLWHLLLVGGAVYLLTKKASASTGSNKVPTAPLDKLSPEGKAALESGATQIQAEREVAQRLTGQVYQSHLTDDEQLLARELNEI